MRIKIRKQVPSTIKGALVAMQKNDIDFDRFVRATQDEWRALAHTLYRQKLLPEAVEPIDVVQELLFWAWKFYGNWRPDGGQPLHRYVTIGACKRATAWLNKQRRAKRNNNGAASRVHVTMGDDFGEFADRVTGTDREASEIVAAIEHAQGFIFSGRTSLDRAILEHVVRSNGCTRVAADRVYSDPSLRLRARLADRGEARRVVSRHVREALERGERPMRDGQPGLPSEESAA